MRSRPILRLLAGTLAITAAACGSDPPVLLDAAPDSGGSRCLVPADYGALGSKTGAANVTAPNSLSVTLDGGPPRDVLFVQLVDGRGVFTGGGIMTGNFAIGGADARLSTCGLCTSVIADIVAGQGPTKFYFTTSGMVSITSVDPVTGSAQNLQLVEIDGAGTPVQGGCTTTIASISFGP
jgi:hypothetical protein